MVAAAAVVVLGEAAGFVEVARVVGAEAAGVEVEACWAALVVTAEVAAAVVETAGLVAPAPLPTVAAPVLVTAEEVCATDADAPAIKVGPGIVYEIPVV